MNKYKSKNYKYIKKIIIIIIAVTLCVKLFSCNRPIKYDNSVFESLQETNLTFRSIDDIGARRILYQEVAAISDGFIAVGVAEDSSLYQPGIGYYVGQLSDTAFITKYDENGEIVWERFFRDGDDKIRFTTIFEVSDGFILNSWHTKGDISKGLLIKFDSDGNYVWAKGPNLTPIIADESGGFLAIGCDNRAIGNNYSNVSMYKNIFVVQFDKDGNKIWKRTIGDRYKIYGYDHIISSGVRTFCSNEGFYLVGYSLSKEKTPMFVAQAFSATPTYNWMSFYNKNGELVWEKLLASRSTYPITIGQDGFYTSGYHLEEEIGRWQYTLKKYDFEEALLWETITNDYENHDMMFAQAIEIDGNVFAFGAKNGNATSDSKYFIRCFDNEGEIIEETEVLPYVPATESGAANIIPHGKMMRTRNGFALYIRQGETSSPIEMYNVLFIYDIETSTYTVKEL